MSFSRLSCNALILPFYLFIVVLRVVPIFDKEAKDKLQVMQKKKCIRFCLKLNSRLHISNELLKK